MIETFNLVELERKTCTSYPVRSTYYNLKPYGLNTIFIESLTSYMGRLAFIHNVTPNRLIKDIISSQENKNELLKRSSYYVKTINLNGVKPFVKECVQGLEHKTGNKNLHLLTMLSWANILNSTGIFKTQRSWCPECYNEMYSKFQEVYDPLVWFFKQIKLCPKHNNVRLKKEENEWQNWIVKNIGRVLLANYNMEPPRTNRVFSIVNQCYEELFKGNKDLFCKCMNLHSVTLCTMKNKQTKVHLNTLLKLSYCTDVDLVDLVSNNIINWTDKKMRVPFVYTE